MSAPLMWLFIAFVAIAGLLCNSGAWLWMSAKWCRIPNVSYWRAMGAVSLISAINVLVEVAVLGLTDWAGRNASRPFILYALATILILAAGAFCLVVILRTTILRALSAGFIALTVSSIAAIAVAIGVRVFIMESFVTPMGSMALAVVGRHFDVECERCGLPAVVSANGRYQMQRRAKGLPSLDFSGKRSRTQVCKCANCGSEQPLADDYRITEGDRILVDKLGGARRWDIVVFRLPEDIETIYLKRLVGLPGETVEIIGGDIFINGLREAKPFGVASEMWLPVNDTRFSPADIYPDDAQWQPSGRSRHWRRTQNGWEFAGAAVEAEDLLFSGSLTDESFYFERWADDPFPADGEQTEQVGDVRITCTLRRFTGAGALAFRWEFQGAKAGATLAADGSVELRAGDEIRRAHLKQLLPSIREIGFAVRDGVVILSTDGGEVATILVGVQDADAARDCAAGDTEPCQIAIAADHCDLDISRIVIEWDVYYTNMGPGCTGCTGQPLLLAPQEHYVLGDHSARSNDSRLWQSVDESLRGRYQVGTVPAELMIGPARCIYWPPRRWHEFR